MENILEAVYLTAIFIFCTVCLTYRILGKIENLRQFCSSKMESPKSEEAPKPEPTPKLEKETEPVKTPKMEKVRLSEFGSVFMGKAKIKDRRQMYISGDIYDKISGYLYTLSDGKTSMVGYINNILAQHIEEYGDTINKMYQQKISNSKPL